MMELKNAKAWAKKCHIWLKDVELSYGGESCVILDDRVAELEKILRELLRVSGYNGSLQGYSKAREAALKILAKGDA